MPSVVDGENRKSYRHARSNGPTNDRVANYRQCYYNITGEGEVKALDNDSKTTTETRR